MTKPHDYVETNRKPSQPPLPFIPDELIREILLRLPARSLLRLQSVCRSWRTLISSSQFANDHVRRSIAADPCLSGTRALYHYNWLLYYKRFGDFSVRSLLENPSEPTEAVLFEGRSGYIITGNCNGLMCLQEYGTNITNLAILWNPCTGLASESLEIGGSLRVSGFGYDHVNDKYKLFGIVDHRMGQRTSRIYTFCRNPSNRAIQNIPLSSIKGDGKGIFVPGTATLNWIRSHSTLDCLVLSLDLVNETFTEFSLPLDNQYNKPFVFPRLCVLRNCLSVCFNPKKTHYWSVWVMKEHGVPQSWTKLAIIPCHPPLSSDHLRPLYIWGNVLMAVASPKILLYNLDNGSFEFSELKTTPSSNSLGLYVHLYHESLVSPSYRGLQSSSSPLRLIKP